VTCQTNYYPQVRFALPSPPCYPVRQWLSGLHVSFKAITRVAHGVKVEAESLDGLSPWGFPD
jgi:hypothetical protein